MAVKITKPGVPGLAVMLGTVGLYLTYVGVKDIAFFDGLRSILRKQRPTPRQIHTAYTPTEIEVNAEQLRAASNVGASLFKGATALAAGDSGIEQLKGCAAANYPVLKKTFSGLIIGGWRATSSVPNSDHPKGLALDIMNPNLLQAEQIIILFRGMPGAKYWIWNRRTASASNNWAIKRYTGPSPHTDHVHLSFTEQGCS